MADTVDLMAFVMNGGQLLEAAERESRVDLSSWLDAHDSVDSLLAATSVHVSESASSSGGGDGDSVVGSPEVDVERIDEEIVPETPSESGDGACDCCSSGGSVYDSDREFRDMSFEDEVFWPSDEEEEDVAGADSSSVDATVAAVAAVVPREVGDPDNYSDISDAEDEDVVSVGDSTVSAGYYSDISSEEDDYGDDDAVDNYMSPSHNNEDEESASPARFEYPDTDGHIGNWLPVVYRASWVHEDPKDCAESDVVCAPAPEGSRARDVCMLTNRPHYFGRVIRKFDFDDDDSDSEDDDIICEGVDDVEDRDLSVDSGVCSSTDACMDYEGDTEDEDCVVVCADCPADDDADCAIVSGYTPLEDDCVITSTDTTGSVEIDGEDVAQRYVLSDSAVSVAPGFGENPKLVCAGLDAIGAATQTLEFLRENDEDMRDRLGASGDRAALEKCGVDGNTRLMLTGPVSLDYESTIALGSNHHDFLNTQLILRQYAEKGVPAWFDSMRVTLSTSAGETYSVSAPAREWRKFHGYFGSFLERPDSDLVCVGAPSPANFRCVFEKLQMAKFIFIYTSSDAVGGDDTNLVRFLKVLSGGFMNVGDGTELLFLSDNPVVVVFREQDFRYPKCLPIIQFVCHDVKPRVYDGDDVFARSRGPLCRCNVCWSDYKCGQSDKPTCSVVPVVRVVGKRKRSVLDDDEEALRDALLASVHPELRDPNAFRGSNSDEDDDNVVVRENENGEFIYEDRNRPVRRRGRPIRFTRPVDEDDASSAFVTVNIINNVDSGDGATSPVALGSDDLPDIDSVTTSVEVPEVVEAPAMAAVPEVVSKPEVVEARVIVVKPPTVHSPPVDRRRTLRSGVRRVLGPRR